MSYVFLVSVINKFGVETQEEILSIERNLIKDLQVLEKAPGPTPEEQMQKQQQQQMLKQQHQQRLEQKHQQRLEQEHQQRLEEQNQEMTRRNILISKQLEEKTRMKELQLEQEKEQRQLQQQQLQQQQQRIHQQQQHINYSMPHPIHPQMLHMDPAIVYQQSMSPVPPRDPAIISSQMKKLNINDTSNRSSNVDPAILFTQSGNSSRLQENSSRSLDPSMLFQQQQLQMNTSQQNFPFQDPAIISVTSTPEFTAPKKPLFGAKKMKKVAKEMVIFEDYSEFESGKGVVKKIQPKKNVESSSSNISFKKKVNSNTGNETPSRTPPIMDASSKQNMVPISLIPPKARRSGSVTPQPQFTAKPVVVEPCRILTVSGGIQIPTVTSSQMEHAKQIASKFFFIHI